VFSEYIEGFQRINADRGDDGYIHIFQPDNDVFYHFKYVLYTEMLTPREAVTSLRNAATTFGNNFLRVYGVPVHEIEIILRGNMDEAEVIIYYVQFYYKDLENYALQAQKIYYRRAKKFYADTETRKSISRIAMAYVELSGGVQNMYIYDEDRYRQAQIGTGGECANTCCDGVGLCRVVCYMRRQGKSDHEIAEILHDGGRWCSIAQIGALLHRDETRVSADSMKKQGSRLLAETGEEILPSFE
jgi:hypothetical protein